MFGSRLRATIALTLTSLAVSSTSREASPESSPLYLAVDPLIGTEWVGNTYPGASIPHGMVQLSPDNGLPGWDRIAGYFYPDSTIAGFSHTHLSGTGAGDLYDISFLPIVGTPLVDHDSPLGIHARFDHADESAHAGYYSVLLQPYNVRVELTATERAGIQRYTFGTASDSAVIILDLDKAMNWDRLLGSGISFPTDSTIVGYRHSDGWARQQIVHFSSRLSRRPERITVDTIPHYDQEEGGARFDGYRVYMHYSVQAGDQITITTALSGVDARGAIANHEAEAPHDDFDLYRQAAEHAWQSRLSRIRISDATESTRRVFYTALYHAHLCPTLYSDVDGRYLGADRAIHQLPEGRRNYSTFSLWDTYRAAHPLYNIVAPELSRDMVASLIAFGKQNDGHLPVWNMWASETDMMIGYHSVPVIIEAILRGVYPIETEAERQELTSLLRSTAERSGYRGLDEYRRLGYVPADTCEESVSLTLEYAYDDSAIAAWARLIGDEELEKTYAKRASSYRQLWDRETGFFRPRLADGRFRTPFDPFAYTPDYTESNAFHYWQSVQHDPQGLMDLVGGRDSLARMLDTFFTAPTPEHIELPIFSTGMLGQYAHGNEPGHHVAFLYNIVRQPWKTAQYTRHICQTLYTDRPDGLCGNEDCGQTSAWYVFASMGMYPLDPITGQYELTSPLFPRVEIETGAEKPFVLEARGLSDQNIYIRSVTIDGKPWTNSYITYEHLRRGSHVVLEMTDEAGICWY